MPIAIDKELYNFVKQIMLKQKIKGKKNLPPFRSGRGIEQF